MNNNIKKIEELANKELKKVIDYAMDKKAVWGDCLDLKLHDAALCNIDFEGYCGAKVTFNDETFIRWFDMFCKGSYIDFMECLERININFEKSIDRIGRTSSFYLGKFHNYDFISDAIYEILELENKYPNIIFNCIDNYITVERYTSDFIKDNENEYISDLLNLIDELMTDFEEYFKPLEEIYNYIMDFKKNQVEYFQNYAKEIIRWNI